VAVLAAAEESRRWIGPVNHRTTTGGVKTGSVRSYAQSSGGRMFPSPNRALVNFAHSGFVKDWRWDDEGNPLAFCM
jgi:hypothetical protein